MSCANCGKINSMGHFGAYVQASPRQLFKNTGFVQRAPNVTAGMHGLGDWFGANQTNWITGIPNEYLVGAGLLLVLVAAMR